MENLFTNILNQAIRKGTKVYQGVNQVGSNLYDGLNQGYNQLDRVFGGALPGGLPPQQQKIRPAPGFAPPKPNNKRPPSGTDLQQRRPEPGYGRPGTKPPGFNPLEAVTTYISEIPQKGAIPFQALTPTHESFLTLGKSLAGPFGRQMRILPSPGTNAQLQKQIDAASVRDGKLIHGLGEPGYEATRFPSNIRGAGIVGQFVGTPTEDNRVIVEEPYDTKPAKWHLDKFVKNLQKGNVPDAAESFINTGIALAGQSGWSNMYPRGIKQDIGELKPDHPLYRAPQ